MPARENSWLSLLYFGGGGYHFIASGPRSHATGLKGMTQDNWNLLSAWSQEILSTGIFWVGIINSTWNNSILPWRGRVFEGQSFSIRAQRMHGWTLAHLEKWTAERQRHVQPICKQRKAIQLPQMSSGATETFCCGRANALRPTQNYVKQSQPTPISRHKGLGPCSGLILISMKFFLNYCPQNKAFTWMSSLNWYTRSNYLVRRPFGHD